MSDLTNNPVSPRPEDDKPFSQRIAHQPVSARVPERVARGVLSTGQLVLDSPKEFCVDFLFGIARPYQVVSRVVMAPQTVSELAGALEQNLQLYSKNFGTTPAAPTPVNPPPPQRPTIQEIYEHFKVSDDVAGGVYANSVMISHTASEFCFDFIAGFYPTSCVNARVLMSASTAPRFLNTLRGSIATWNARKQPQGGGGGAGGMGPMGPEMGGSLPGGSGPGGSPSGGPDGPSSPNFGGNGGSGMGPA